MSCTLSLATGSLQNAECGAWSVESREVHKLGNKVKNGGQYERYRL